MIHKIKNNNLYFRISRWEFWPVWLAYLPVIPVIAFYAIKTRAFFFFSNVNPLFKTGALLGASKYKILNQIPDVYKPITILVKNKESNIDNILKLMEQAQLSFPIIAKPDIGERGMLVSLIHSKEALSDYIKANAIDILIQEFIQLPNECGIFYIRKPSDIKGKVVSIGLKEFLNVVGNGKDTIHQLISNNPRYIFQAERLNALHADIMSDVPGLGETINLEPIGNHSRGTGFLNGNHLISEALDMLFDDINSQMTEVHYGRFDVKYDTWEKLLQGKDIKILEMNGVASEPIHIYDDKVKIKDKYKSFYSLWKSIYEISLIQKARGIHPINVKCALKEVFLYKRYINSLNL